MQDLHPGKACVKDAAAPKLTLLSTAQILRILKLCTFILLVGFLHATAAGYGQTITLSEKNVPLTKVFAEIKKQTGYQFLYISQSLENAKKVTVVVKEASVEDVLNICFKDQPLSYAIKENTVIIKPKSTTVSSTSFESAPPKDIKGRVVDAEGKPVADATVTVKGTNTSTRTNANGDFEIMGVNDGNVSLVITHVNYDAMTLAVKGSGMVMATMQVKVNSLDEAVVIAYGTTTKRFSTGNVSSVKASDIEKQPVNNPLLALQGRVPGLFITQNNGLAGSGVTVRIQGQNSIASGNDPLYIIDGVPYTSQLLPTIITPLGTSGGPSVNGNPMSFLNPSDIESIEVLKDADATAIYGSRAGNGAILITTKKGKTGKIKVDVNVQKGWGKVAKKIDLLNTEQYLEMRREAKKNDNSGLLSTDYDINGTWDTTKYTDWQEKLIGNTSKYFDLYSTISGGNSNTQFLIGSGYHKETSVFPNNFSDKKGSVHFNITGVSNNQKFSIQFSGSYLVDNNQLPRTDLTAEAINLAPNAPSLYNEDGTINWAPTASGSSTWANPLANSTRIYRNKTSNLISNGVLKYKILPELELASSVGYNNLESDEFLPFPNSARTPESQLTAVRNATYTSSAINSWVFEPQITYKKTLVKGKIDGLLGLTIQENNNSVQVLSANGFNSDLTIENIKAASNVSVVNTISSLYKYNAVFARLNYNWEDMFIVNIVARRDGSSRFGSDNIFHNFGSLAGAWIFSKSNFFRDKVPCLNFGKIRASYGTSGNDQIGDYSHMSLFNPINGAIAYQGSNGLTVSRLSNPNLQWEETKKLQVGVDLSFIDEKFFLTTNYAINRSSNQLLTYELPVMTGYSSVLENFPARIQNTSWEISLNVANIKNRSFSYSGSINLTIPKNKLISFPNLDSSSYASSLIIGQPLEIYKAYHLLGVNPLTGIYEFADKHGNSTSTPDFFEDRTVLINTLPKFYGGFQNTLKYGGLEIDVFFQFVKQLGRNNYFGTSLLPGTARVNQLKTVLNRWQKPGDDKSIQMYSANSSLNGQYSDAVSSDAGFSDASFIRLKTMSVSWQLPQNWLSKFHFTTLRAYVHGQNLLTFTKYKGLDPESQNILSLPPLRVITAGIQVGL